MTITAIETIYAGRRFRSRLEARWAVFFDSLGVPWDYETQGYLVGEKRRPYLPDFRLPGAGIWVEVKGEMNALDLSLADDAVNVANGLPGSDPFGELSLLILGPIPEPGAAHLHWLLSRTAPAVDSDFCPCHELHFSQVTFQAFPAAALEEIRREYPGQEIRSPGALVTQIGRSLMHPLYEDIVVARPCGILLPDPAVLKAFTAARSARFEHGETPQVPGPQRGDPSPIGTDVRERIAHLCAEHLPGDAA